MPQPYNVFISWSGERSKIVALALRDWLPTVLQAVNPWMSDENIAKGSRGLEEILKALGGMKVGITCLTPENLDEPWLLFEAGALIKAVDDRTRLCTYLLAGLKPETVKMPLGMFQATRADCEDTRKLVYSINQAVGEEPVKKDRLDSIFDALWPKLEAVIKNVPSSPSVSVPRRTTDDMVGEILEIVRNLPPANPISFANVPFNTANIPGHLAFDPPGSIRFLPEGLVYSPEEKTFFEVKLPTNPFKKNDKNEK